MVAVVGGVVQVGDLHRIGLALALALPLVLASSPTPSPHLTRIRMEKEMEDRPMRGSPCPVKYTASLFRHTHTTLPDSLGSCFTIDDGPGGRLRSN